jgi:peptidyl-prolyl cis-trans isomerase C
VPASHSKSSWLSEPVLHFALLGAALYLLYGLVSAPPESSAQPVLLSDAMLDSLRSEHATRTGAAPDDREEAALIETWHGEQALYLEAVALGLDRGDPVVRRRLVQKMQFLLDDAGVVAEPSDAVLGAWLAGHSSDYAHPERLSLTHVFVPARDDEARVEARRLLGLLLAGAEPGPLGAPFLQGRELGPSTPAVLGRVFGPEFAEGVVTLPAGRWTGPVESSYGLHLVRIEGREPGREATLDEVRADVRRDWERAHRAELARDAVSRLRERYSLAREGSE